MSMVLLSAPIVHGFAQAVYTVMEEEILDTRFQLNVKGMTRFPGALNIPGTIISVAGGDTSEYSSMCPSLQHSVYNISQHLVLILSISNPLYSQMKLIFVYSLSMIKSHWNIMSMSL